MSLLHSLVGLCLCLSYLLVFLSLTVHSSYCERTWPGSPRQAAGPELRVAARIPPRPRVPAQPPSFPGCCRQRPSDAGPGSGAFQPQSARARKSNCWLHPLPVSASFSLPLPMRFLYLAVLMSIFHCTSLLYTKHFSPLLPSSFAPPRALLLCASQAPDGSRRFVWLGPAIGVCVYQ